MRGNTLDSSFSRFPTLLLRYRVRLAVGDLLEAQSQREGRAVWLKMKDFLLNDIEDHRVRIVAADDNNAAHRGMLHVLYTFVYLVL